MKTLASKESRTSCPSIRRQPSSAHTPARANFRAQRATVRQIVQPKLSIGQPNDKYEQEADRVADRVVTNQPVAEISPISSSFVPPLNQKAQAETVEEDLPQESEVQRQPEEEEEQVQPKLLQRQPEEEEEQSVQPKLLHRRSLEDEDDPVQARGVIPSAQAASQAINNQSSGSPIRVDVRNTLESGIGTDLSPVRVHEDSEAHEAAASINAKAFTHKNDIWLGAGQSQSDLHLMAHETTHVVQQGGGLQTANPGISQAYPAVQRIWNPFSAAADLVGDAVEWIGDSINAAVDFIKDKASEFIQNMPGYSLFTVVNGSDPITGRTVERNGRNFIEAGLDVIPGGSDLKQKLEDEGAIEEAALWLDDQIRELDFSPTEIGAQLSNFWSSLEIADATRIPTVMDRLFNIINGPVQRIISFARNVGEKLLEIVKDYLISSLINFIKDHTTAYPLLTVILEKDPISGEAVEHTPMALIRGFMLLSESGAEQLRQMEESGSLQRAVDWLDGAVARLNLSWEMLVNGFMEIWRSVGIHSLMDPGGVFGQIYDTFAAPVGRIINFVIEIAVKVLGFIKDALINRLVEYARTVRGYPLITVILGKDPFSQEPVERSTANIIRGFMSLMENGEQQYQEMEQSGAIAGMTARVETAMGMLNFTWEYIRGLFLRAWNSFSLQDLIAPFEAFGRLLAIFGGPILRLINFVWEIIKIVIEVVMEVMNFPIDLIRNIITRAMQAIEDIKRDPIAFLKNLLLAVKTGFQQFFGNILTHLLNGLTGWLFSELREANINPPTDLSFRSILGFVLEVLGITVERIWEKLAERIGQERVDRIRGMIDRLTGIWTFVKDVMTRGPVAIWEYIQERLSNLWDTVLGAIRDWVMTRIVERITVRLLSMLDPTGIMAVVNGFIAFYNAVQSFIRYLREMLEIVNSFVVGVAELARGNVTIAANFLENSLAQAVPIAIGFLANQVGLSGLGRRIGEMIERVRAMVDEGLTWLVDRAVSAGTSFLNSVGLGGGATEDESTESAGEGGDWRDEEGEFQEDGQRHEVTYDGSNIMVASENPTELEDLKEEREERSGTLDSDQLAAYNAAVTLKSELESLTDQFAQAQMNNDTAEMASKETQIRELLQTLATHLQSANLFEGQTPLDPTNVMFEQQGGKAGSVTAEPLTRVPGNTQGEAQSGGGPNLLGWEYASSVNSSSYILNADGEPEKTSSGRLRLSKPWKKVHVLSHLLHGPLRVWNLTPGTQQMNSTFLSSFESTLKTGVEDEKTYSFSINLNYYANQGKVKSILQGDRSISASDSDFVETATVTMGEKDAETGEYEKETFTVDGSPLPNVEGASLEFTIRHLKAAIDRNVDGWGDSMQIKTWGVYKRDHINRNVRNRLGETTMNDLHQHYQQKIEQRFSSE